MERIHRKHLILRAALVYGISALYVHLIVHISKGSVAQCLLLGQPSTDAVPARILLFHCYPKLYCKQHFST